MYLKEKNDLLSVLRNRNLPIEDFRKTTEKLVHYLTLEQHAEKEIVLIPILRSGLAMLHPFIQRFPTAPIGFFGMFRDEKTLKPHLYYKNLPPLHYQQKILLLDPMLATGSSMELAIQLLLEEGVLEKQIIVIILIGSKMGFETIQRKYPQVQIKYAALDEKLDSFGFILPGLGDFGDRFFGTNHK